MTERRTIVPRRRLVPNPDPDQTMVKSRYIESPSDDNVRASPSAGTREHVNAERSHTYRDRLTSSATAVPFPLEYEDTSSDESFTGSSSRSSLLIQGPPRAANLRDQRNSGHPTVRPCRDVSTRQNAPTVNTSDDNRRLERLRVTVTGDETAQARTTQYTAPQYRNGEDLLGFIPVHRRRPRTAALFASGILIKNNNIDDTITGIHSYVTKHGCDVKSVHKLRKFDMTISVKIIVLESDSEKLLETGFWPAGIRCRLWVQN